MTPEQYARIDDPEIDKHDKGPWTVIDAGGHIIESDDFTHDVQLHVKGDFFDDAQRHAYSAELARVLNAAIRPPYPEGIVVGACVCGSWPGGECLRCSWN